MFFTEQKRKRQSNITHANDPDPRLMGLDAMLQFFRAH
jgi:hypothetical protein